MDKKRVIGFMLATWWLTMFGCWSGFQIMYPETLQGASGIQNRHETTQRPGAIQGPSDSGSGSLVIGEPVAVPVPFKENGQTGNPKNDPCCDKPTDWPAIALGAGMLLFAGLQAYLVWRQHAEARQKNRAYLGIKKPTLFDFLQMSQPYATVGITNHGATPANALMVCVAMVAADKRTFDFPADEYITFFPGTVMPGGSYTMMVQMYDELDQETIVSVDIGDNRTVFVYGTIFYTDVFGFRRITQFRLFVTKGATGHVLGVCEHGNHAS